MTDSASVGVGSAPRPAVWRRAADAAYVESPGRVVVLDLDRPDRPPYVFEGSAAEIWALLDGERAQASIAAEVARAHDVGIVVVEQDVHEFLQTLQGLGLVVRDQS